MEKNYKSGSIYISMPNKMFVRLRDGIKILLFSVSLTVATPTYGFKETEPAEQAESFFQTAENLFSSLEEHRLNLMSATDIDNFWAVAKEVSYLDFTDSMVCYEPYDKQITYDILDKSGLVLHLTQYVDELKKDQVVFSVERNTRFLVAGHTSVEGMGKHLQTILNNIS